MSAQVIEGIISVGEDDGIGHYEVFIGDINVGEWAEAAIPYDGSGNKPPVKAILMVEDEVCLEAQGRLYASEGEYGYSSWTPGSGPSVDVWDDAKDHDFIEAMEKHDGRNAALSLEAIA